MSVESNHHGTHMPTVIAIAFLVIAIVGQAVAFAYVFGQLHQQVQSNTSLTQQNERAITAINATTNTKLDELSRQLALSRQSRHYDERMIQAIAKKVGVTGLGNNGD